MVFPRKELANFLSNIKWSSLETHVQGCIVCIDYVYAFRNIYAHSYISIHVTTIKKIGHKVEKTKD